MRSLCAGLGWSPLVGDGGARFRYSDLTFTATFDHTCWRKDTFCHSTVVLKDARLEQAGHPRLSRDGLVAERAMLVDPPADVAGPVIELGRVSTPEGNRQGTFFRAFAFARDPLLKNEAVICAAHPVLGDPPIWPDTETGALLARSPSDRYQCWSSRKVDGRWLIDLV